MKRDTQQTSTHTQTHIHTLLHTHSNKREKHRQGAGGGAHEHTAGSAPIFCSNFPFGGMVWIDPRVGVSCVVCRLAENRVPGGGYPDR